MTSAARSTTRASAPSSAGARTSASRAASRRPCGGTSVFDMAVGLRRASPTFGRWSANTSRPKTAGYFACRKVRARLLRDQRRSGVPVQMQRLLCTGARALHTLERPGLRDRVAATRRRASPVGKRSTRSTARSSRVLRMIGARSAGGAARGRAVRRPNRRRRFPGAPSRRQSRFAAALPCAPGRRSTASEHKTGPSR